jgi:N-lysine methyltransferase SETD6
MDAIASSSTSIPPAGSGHDFDSLASIERAFVSSFLSSGGSLSRSISLTELPGQGRCFVANEGIEDDAELFTIPRAMLLNTRNSQLPCLCQDWEQANGIEASPAADPTLRGDNDMSLDEIKLPAEDDDEATSRPPRLWSELSGWSPLILCMMWEQWRAANPTATPSTASHDWSSYLAIMPNDFSHMPMFWPESDLGHLKGTAVLDRIGRDEADEEYNRNIRPFIRMHAPVFFGQDERVQNEPSLEGLIDEYYSLKEFHIQGSRILSRSFHVKKEDQADVKEGRAVAAGDADQSREIQEDDDDSDEEDEEEELEQTSDISMVAMADMLNASYASDNVSTIRRLTSIRCQGTAS